VRLELVLRADLRRVAGQLALVVRERSFELLRHAHERPVRRELDGEGAHPVAVELARQGPRTRLRLLDRRRPGRRVSVHVAPDPRPERKRRQRAGKPVTPLAQQRLRGVEEAVFEEPEAVADLVGDPQAVVSNLVRLPQQRHLLGKPLLDGAASRCSEEGIVEPVELLGDARVREQDRSPARLGRVRGQHQPHRHVACAALELVRRHVGEELESALERVARNPSGVRVLAPATDPVLLLGDVRELEVHGEGAQDECLLLPRDRAYGRAHLFHGAALPGGSRKQAHALDDLQKPFAFLLDEHRSEDGPEEPDVAAEHQSYGAIVSPIAAPGYGCRRGFSHATHEGRSWFRQKSKNAEAP
jgi:hypothetical protein